MRLQPAMTRIALIVCLVAGSVSYSDSDELLHEQSDAADSSTPSTHPLECLRVNHDTAGMRRHAWRTLMQVTMPDRSGTEEWLTWTPVQSVLSGRDDFVGSPWSAIDTPAQLEQADPVDPISPVSSNGPIPHVLPAPSLGRVSLVMYNPAAQRFVSDRGYRKVAEMVTDADTSATRQINEWPRDAILVKAVWWRAPRDRAIGVPVWDGRYHRPISGPDGKNTGVDMDTWDRIVVLDRRNPPLPEGSLDTVNSFDVSLDRPRSSRSRPCRQGQVVHLDRFWHHVLTRDDVVRLSKNARIIETLQSAFKDPVQEGDALILLGFHIMTNEIDNWTWTTLWWHDGRGDSYWPDDAPPNLAKEWRNYRMDVSFGILPPSIKAPEPRRYLYQDRVQYIANPYLEFGVRRGVASNCAGCHQRAAITGGGSSKSMNQVDPVEEMQQGELAEWREGGAGLRFVWSLAREREKAESP